MATFVSMFTSVVNVWTTVVKASTTAAIVLKTHSQRVDNPLSMLFKDIKKVGYLLTTADNALTLHLLHIDNVFLTC